MNPNQFKKSALVTASIAREMISISPGARIPTIQEYTQSFDSSRGVVQNALAILQREGGVALDNRGKLGTYLISRNVETLYGLANINSITGSMPTPLNPYLSGLATGICQTMGGCPVPFNFAFMQGAEKRAEALLKGVYDFVVVSQSSANEFCRRHSELEIVMPLAGSVYSPPYFLYCNAKNPDGMTDGAVVALDSKSTDHYLLTMRLAAGKDVHFHPISYVGAHSVFLAGEVDCVVFRKEKRMDEHAFRILPIEVERPDEYLRPAVLINRSNYGMGSILRNYLERDCIARWQSDVVERRTEARFY